MERGTYLAKIAAELGSPGRQSLIPSEDVLEIVKARQAGESRQDVALRWGISIHTVSSYSTGRRRREVTAGLRCL
jgi:DNA-binding CsgD family transcriptional regulator